MEDLVASVANCLLVGEERVPTAAGGWRLALIRVKLGRHDVELRQLDIGQRPWRTYRHGFVHSTEIVVKSPRSRASAQAIALDTCELLSFAAMSQVHCFAVKQGAWYHKWSTRGITDHARPTIDLGDGAAVRRFLESTWSEYRRQKRSRRLAVVFDYVVSAALTERNPIEVQLLLTFVALENLKATFARGKRIPESDRGFHRISVSTAAGLTKRALKNRPVYTFRELLSDMLKGVGMARGLKSLVRLRNQIVHNGLSTWKFSTRVRMLDRNHDILREYVLRLLGFRGEYLEYSSGSRTTRTL